MIAHKMSNAPIIETVLNPFLPPKMILPVNFGLINKNPPIRAIIAKETVTFLDLSHLENLFVLVIFLIGGYNI